MKGRKKSAVEGATQNYWMVGRCWRRGKGPALNVGQGLALLNEHTTGPHRRVNPLVDGLKADIVANARGPKKGAPGAAVKTGAAKKNSRG